MDKQPRCAQELSVAYSPYLAIAVIRLYSASIAQARTDGPEKSIPQHTKVICVPKLMSRDRIRCRLTYYGVPADALYYDYHLCRWSNTDCWPLLRKRFRVQALVIRGAVASRSTRTPRRNSPPRRSRAHLRKGARSSATAATLAVLVTLIFQTPTARLA